MKATKQDMLLAKEKISFERPDDLPIKFQYGPRRQTVFGIPSEFSPTFSVEEKGEKIITTYIGRDEKGLEIKVEKTEYTDFPAVEYVAFFTNRSKENSDRLYRVKVFAKEIGGKRPKITRNIGDTHEETGYQSITEQIYEKMIITPTNGTPCSGASPFLRVSFKDFGVNIGVGWPGKWSANIMPLASPKSGIMYELGQDRCDISLYPNETIRTPSITLMCYEGDENRGRNLWRSFFRKHIMPRPNGEMIGPKLVGLTPVPGFEEFCGTTESQQLESIDKYLESGIKPDIWWIDAGWYPCRGHWTITGSWRPNPENYPNGLHSIGKKCREHEIDFLLWFEPERARKGSDIHTEHPEYTLDYGDDLLVNYSIPECVEYMTDKLDKIIKDSGVTIYRQDFNIDPMPYFIKYEDAGRFGAIENGHVQGYLKLWDNLLERNPGLLIDSCASGGRRNEMETLKRSVPFHYTDVGYGIHPIRQLQYRFLNEWTVFYRSMCADWRDENNVYAKGNNHVCDDFSMYNTVASPSINVGKTELHKKFIPVWRKAAEIMLDSDYYPLTECRKSTEDFFAQQFVNEEKREGFIHIVNNVDNEESECVLYPELSENETYVFTDALDPSDSFEISQYDKNNGLKVTLEKANGKIWFYKY